MAKRSEFLQSHKFYLVPLFACFIDLIYLPNLADPLNPIKFWVLGCAALSFLGLIISSLPNIRAEISNSRVVMMTFVIIAIFVGALISAFFFTDVKSIGLIGFYGRNTGTLFYIFLSIIFFYCSLKFHFVSIKYFYFIVSCISFVFAIYGALQHFNLDFIQWNAPFNKIVLTIGNPDFSAALLAIFVAIIFPAMFLKIPRSTKTAVGFLILFLAVIIYWTNARQGLIGLLAGLSFTLLLVLWQKSHRLAVALFVTDFILALIAILGTLQIVPLTGYMYKSSVNDRGYNWRAAWHMFVTHPWTGVGIDRYAASFFKYQDPKYPLIYGNSQLVNNAHSDYLQFFATGGILLGISYTALTIFVGWRAVKVVQRYKSTEQIIISGVIGGWIVFVAQSFISPDNQCVTIWGWLLGGMIIGLSISESSVEIPVILRSKISNNNILRKYLISVMLIIFFLFTVVAPMYKGEIRVANFLKIDPASINSAPLRAAYLKLSSQAFDTPLISLDYKVRIAFNITNVGLINEGKSYFEQILKEDPKKSDAPQFLAEIYESQRMYLEAIKYRIATRSVNPWNTGNLLALERDYLAVGNRSLAGSLRNSIIGMAPGTDNANKAAKAITG